MISPMRCKYSKNQRLHRNKEIKELFQNGKALYFKDLKLLYSVSTDTQESSTKSMVVAPKKIFKKAVQRNFVKRILREIVRLNKNNLEIYCSENQIALNFAIFYSGLHSMDFNHESSNVIVLFTKLIEKIKATT